MSFLGHHRIPISDDYGTCRECWAELRLGSASLSLSTAAEALGLGTQDFEKSDGGWALSSRDQIFSRDLRRHLDWLLARLAGRKVQLDSLRWQGVQAEVYCAWLGEMGGPAFWPEQMAGLAALDLDLVLDYSWADPLERDEEN